MMDVDVYERDADLTELVKVEGRNTESAMFHRCEMLCSTTREET